MGTDKARLRLGGQSLLDRAVRTLLPSCAEVVVAGRSGDGARPWTGLEDSLEDAGPLAGIHRGLQHAAGRDVFALACDLPRVEGDLVEYLVSRGGEVLGNGTVRIVLPRAAGRLQPLCALYSSSCLEPIAAFLRSGGRRVLDFVASVRSTVIDLPEEYRAARVLENVNEPSEARVLGIEVSSGDVR